MDETLLSSDASICQRNRDAIRKATDKGVKFVPCTGRGYRSVEGVLQTLHLSNEPDQYVIGYNGANITENKDSKCLYWNGIPFDLANAIYKQLVSYNLCTHIYTREHVYIRAITPDEAAFLHGRMGYIPTDETSLDFLQGEDVGKLIVMNTDNDILEKIRQALQPLLADIMVSYSSNRYMEFMHKGVTKGVGLQKLADLLHIPIEETMAIGDNINDREMLETAGLSVGVANLNPVVRSCCKVITTADNNAGAVAEAIERFILS
jgi:Cof subfamily protein (haloacid dehalogenase superfamily)